MEPLTIKTPYAMIKQQTTDHVMTATKQTSRKGQEILLNYPPGHVMSPSPRTTMKK
jgi:hypothetical protein